MFVTLKIIHFVALLMGGAATIAPGLMLRSLRRTGHDGPPPQAMAMTLRILGIMGLVAIILLWISGLIMTSLGYDGAPLGLWFLVKLAAAAIILGCSATLNLMAARAARTGVPVNPVLSRRMVAVIRGMLLLAIICAAIVFS